MQCKFVTFEEKILATAKKSEQNNFDQVPLAKITRHNEIPGYKIEDNRIYKIKDYKWNKDDWSNYNYWLKKFTQLRLWEKRKLLIMAAWDQTKGRPLPIDAVL